MAPFASVSSACVQFGKLNESELAVIPPENVEVEFPLIVIACAEVSWLSEIPPANEEVAEEEFVSFPPKIPKDDEVALVKVVFPASVALPVACSVVLALSD